MRSIVLSVAVVSGFVLSGCSEPGAHVTGVLVEDGKPVTPTESEEIEMSFVSVQPDAKVSVAIVDFDSSSGAFSVRGPERASIPPGEYKVVVALAPYQEAEKDRFKGAFSEEKTPLRYVVTADSRQDIVVDVKEKTIKRK